MGNYEERPHCNVARTPSALLIRERENQEYIQERRGQSNCCFAVPHTATTAFPWHRELELLTFIHDTGKFRLFLYIHIYILYIRSLFLFREQHLFFTPRRARGKRVIDSPEYSFIQIDFVSSNSPRRSPFFRQNYVIFSPRARRMRIR